MKFLFVLSTVFLFAGCGLELDSEDSRNRELERDAELRAQYSQVEGTYLGAGSTVIDGETKTFSVELGLKVASSSTGTNSEGRDIPISTLEGQFRRTDVVQFSDFVNFQTTYNEVDGTIRLFLDDSQPGVEVSARIVGGQLVDGRLDLPSGFGGTFTAEKVQNRVMARSANSEIERIRQVYAPIVGIYRGAFSASSASRSDRGFESELRVDLQFISTTDAPQTPDEVGVEFRLLGTWRRLDVDDEQVVGATKQGVVTFDPLSGRVSFSGTPPALSAQNTNDFQISAFGKLVGDQLMFSEVTESQGFRGRVSGSFSGARIPSAL